MVVVWLKRVGGVGVEKVVAHCGKYCQVQCSIVKYNAVLSSTMQYCQVQCSIVKYNAVLSNTMQYCQIQCSIG